MVSLGNSSVIQKNVHKNLGRHIKISTANLFIIDHKVLYHVLFLFWAHLAPAWGFCVLKAGVSQTILQSLEQSKGLAIIPMWLTPRNRMVGKKLQLLI